MAGVNFRFDSVSESEILEIQRNKTTVTKKKKKEANKKHTMSGNARKYEISETK